MRTCFLTLLSLCLCCPAFAGAQTGKPDLHCLSAVADVRLPGSTSRFDYQSIDTKRGLLFISHLGDNSVTVFDLKSRKVIRNITGIPSPHGILAVPELGRVFVSATKVNEIYTIDESSLKVMAKTAAGYFPDGIGFAPGSKRVFVSDEFGGTVTVIDARSLKLIRKMKIGRQIGNTHYDPVSGEIVTADESRNELVYIDPTTLKIVERIGLPGCEGAHGFVIGTSPHFAYVTGEDNASLVVVDLASKKVIQHFKVGREPDVLAIDGGLGLLYVSSESGIVSIFRIHGDGLSKSCQGHLWAHAHTVSVDEKTHDVYFPLQNVNGFPTLKIMRPSLR